MISRSILDKLELGMIHAKGGGGSSKTTTEPSPEQEAILRKQLSIANQLEGQGQLRFFPGQTLADQSQFTRLGQIGALRQAPGLQRFAGQQQNAVGGLLGTRGTNIQGVQAVNEDLQRALTAPITRNFREQILPGLSSAAVRGGAFGGDRAEIAKGIAAGRAGEDIANVLTRASVGLQGQLANQGLNREQLRQAGITSGLGFADQASRAALLPSQVLGRVGQQQQDRQQSEIDAIRERFEFQEFGPTDLANRINSILGGINFGSSTTSKSSGGGK